jgi:hypothetical protein
MSREVDVNKHLMNSEAEIWQPHHCTSSCSPCNMAKDKFLLLISLKVKMGITLKGLDVRD